MKQLLADEIGELASGEIVYQRPKSHANRDLDAELEKFIPLALRRIDSKKKESVISTIDFGVNIAEMHSGGASLEKVPTSLVSVELKKIPQGYIIVNAHFGPKSS